MKDPALEARARALSAELRCLVCQNQSIDDSDAPLARDIRILIRQRIDEGESNDAVRAYLVSRYGDFILLKPPFKPETLLLWLSPALTLGAGLAAALFARRRAPRATPALSAEEEARLAALTGGDATWSLTRDGAHGLRAAMPARIRRFNSSCSPLTRLVARRPAALARRYAVPAARPRAARPMTGVTGARRLRSQADFRAAKPFRLR